MKFRTILLLFIPLFFTYQLDAQAPMYTWARSIGATSNDQGKSIVTDQFDNVYITGEFRNTVDFDPGMSVFNLTSNGAQDIFIENQILVAIKVVPLGQNAGQRLLNRLIPVGEESIRQSMTLSPDDLSNFSPLQAIASAKHETQYSRLFRS